MLKKKKKEQGVTCGKVDVIVHRYHHQTHHITVCPQWNHIWSFKDRHLESYVNSPNFKYWQLI